MRIKNEFFKVKNDKTRLVCVSHCSELRCKSTVDFSIYFVVSKNCCSSADSNSCQRVPSQARYL